MAARDRSHNRHRGGRDQTFRPVEDFGAPAT